MPATHTPLYCESYVAGADLSAAEGKFVKLSSTEGQVVLAGLGERAIGVVVEGAASGKTVTVQIFGRARVLAGGALATIGVAIKSDASGLAAAAAATSVSGAAVTGSHVVGILETAAANANEFVTVLLLPIGVPPTTAA